MSQAKQPTLGAAGFILLGSAALFFLLTQITNHRATFVKTLTYEITAEFDNIADLKTGARVAMAGVEIGRVAGIRFDPADHRVLVIMRVNAQYDHIPQDSTASVNTQGLLGGKIINLTNGGSDAYLRNSDRIMNTRSATSLESMISRLFTAYLAEKSAPKPGGQ